MPYSWNMACALSLTFSFLAFILKLNFCPFFDSRRMHQTKKNLTPRRCLKWRSLTKTKRTIQSATPRGDERIDRLGSWVRKPIWLLLSLMAWTYSQIYHRSSTYSSAVHRKAKWPAWSRIKSLDETKIENGASHGCVYLEESILFQYCRDLDDPAGWDVEVIDTCVLTQKKITEDIMIAQSKWHGGTIIRTQQEGWSTCGLLEEVKICRRCSDFNGESGTN